MLNRTQQFGLKKEAVESSEETLAAADYSFNFSEPGQSLVIDRYARNLTRPTLTPLQSIPGSRLKKINVIVELVGGGAATEATWHRILEVCGFSKTQIKVVTAVTVTNGPFKCGQTIGNNAVLGSATKTGIFVEQIAGSPNKLVYMPLTGTFADTDTMYNYVSPQTSASLAGSAAPANAGYRFSPMTESDSAVPPSATAEIRLGGLRHTLVGGRGTGSLKFERNKCALLTFEVTGMPVFDTDGITPRAGAIVANVPALGNAPKLANGIPIVIRDGSTDYKPVLTMVDFKFNVTVTGRETANDDAVLGSGFKGVRQTDRKMQASMDPEMVLPASYNVVGLIVGGATTEILAKIGGAGEANGLVIAHAPKGQHVSDFSPGDRGGITTAPVDIDLSGDSDDEMSISHVFA